MSKLLIFMQTKGKWHKSPSFNLEGGAKLYRNFAQKLLAVSLCMAVVLLGTPVTTYIASAEDPSPITIKYGSVPVSSVALLAERSVSLSAVGSGITWSSSDTSIVSVNNGRLTAGGPGRATVSVTAAGGSGSGSGSVSVYVYSGEKIFDGVKYATLEYLDNGKTVREAMVAGFKDSLPSVLTLPSSVTLDGSVYSVTAVQEKAFWHCDSMTSVTVPNSVRFVGSSAFLDCDQLSAVALPSSLAALPDGLFSSCEALASLSLPSSVTAVGDGAFASCLNLTSVSLPLGLTAVGNGSFSSCPKLTTVTLPPTVSSVGSWAFGDCSALSKVFYKQGLDLTAAGVPAAANLLAYTVVNASASHVKVKISDVTLGSGTTSVSLCPYAMGEGYEITSVASGVAGVSLLDDHSWQDATCTEPKTCSVCRETEGAANGHSWVDATCTEPKTCSVCRETEGAAKGHTWVDATCTTPKTCSVCRETEGAAKGHTWVDATCTEPKTCSVCGETEGEVDQDAHDLSDVVVSEPTAEKLGEVLSMCSRGDYYVFSHYTLKDGTSPTMYPNGSPIRSTVMTPTAVSTFDLNGQEITIFLQDPLGVLGSGTLGLTVRQIDLPTTFDGDVPIEHQHSYDIIPTVDGIEKSGQLSNKVRLLYKIPQGWDRADLEVFLAQAGEDGEFSETIEKMGGDEYLVIWTDHFSPYVFVDKLNPEEKAELEALQAADGSNVDSNTPQYGEDNGQSNSNHSEGESNNNKKDGSHSVKTGDTSGEIFLISTLAMIATGLYLGLCLEKKKSF